MKIVVCEFNQETNSFNPVTTKMEDYEQGGIYRGEEMLRELKDKPKYTLLAFMTPLYYYIISIIVPYIADN
jgi:microcystin degradation protein MlrC